MKHDHCRHRPSFSCARGGGHGVRIIKQYEKGVLFRFGRCKALGTGAAPDRPDRRRAAPRVDADRHDAHPVAGDHHPRQRERGVSAVAYFRIVDAVKSGVAIENVYVAIDQIAQTTLRKVVGSTR
jgi:regulator of protease activity HflC (stomatin/prohibitin superfamily)